jgi:hypothetical protein
VTAGAIANAEIDRDPDALFISKRVTWRSSKEYAARGYSADRTYPIMWWATVKSGPNILSPGPFGPFR